MAEGKIEVIKALALILVPVILLFGVDPVLLWASLNIGISLHVSFWGVYAIWVFVVALTGTTMTVYYLFSPDENSPKAQRVIHQLVSGDKNEHTR